MLLFNIFHRISRRFRWKFLGISPNPQAESSSRIFYTMLKISEFRINSSKISLILTMFFPNSDRTLIWKVRMVRSLANRTFQPRSAGCPCMEWAGLESYLVNDDMNIEVQPQGRAGEKCPELQISLHEMDYRGKIVVKCWLHSLPNVCQILQSTFFDTKSC